MYEENPELYRRESMRAGGPRLRISPRELVHVPTSRLALRASSCAGTASTSTLFSDLSAGGHTTVSRAAKPSQAGPILTE
jgi:hypothetical protein